VSSPSVSLRSGVQARQLQLLIGLLFLAAAAALAAEALSTVDQPTHAVVWSALALASYAAGLLCLAGLNTGTGLGLTGWRIGSWILLWYGLAFGLATITWIQSQDSGATAQIATSNVPRAMVLVAVGMTFWVLGYLAGPSRAVHRQAARGVGNLGQRFTGQIRSRLAPWVLYAIGVAARLASAATSGHFGYVGDVTSVTSSATSYDQILSLLSLCAPLAVAAAAIQVYWEGIREARFTLAVLFAIELVFGAAAGGKQNFIIAVLAVVIPMSAARRRLPKTLVIVAILIFLFVAIPFNTAYRNAEHSSTGTVTTSEVLSQAPEIFSQTINTHSMATALPNSVPLLLQRIREIDSPAIIVQRTPSQIPFKSATQLIEAPLAEIVPRAVWPGKPILATGYQFSQQYFGLPSGLTSSAVTPVGDLYTYGGWPPVIVGMFLLGCVVRLLDGVLDVRTNPHAIFLVLLLFPSLVKDEGGWVSTMAGIPATIVIWLVAVSLTFRVRRAA
jgi:hypothetical protein